MAKLWGSFRAFGESRQRNERVFWIAIPYFVLRLAISFLLEMIGLSLVWVIRAVAFVALKVYRGIMKIGSLIGAVFSKVFGERSDDSDEVAGKGLYRRLIRWALDSPVAMIALAAACFWITYSVGRSLETELLPEVHQSEFTFEVSLPVGTPLDETVKLLSDVEQKILDSKKVKDSKIETLLVMYGFDTSNMKRSDEG